MIEFQDVDGDTFRLDDASPSISKHIGKPVLWIGLWDNKCLVGQQMVRELIPALQRFVDTGSVEKPAVATDTGAKP